MKTAVKERPILFSGPMVRAILEGRKTQTRRPIVLPQWARGRDIEIDEYGLACCFDGRQETEAWLTCPYAKIEVDWTQGKMRPRYKLGTRLWVRETWGIGSGQGSLVDPCLNYASDGAQIPIMRFEGQWRCAGRFVCWEDDPAVLWRFADTGWRPSIHMPRWASRITLEIVGVRVERLQTISPEECIMEGFEPKLGQSVTDHFRGMWDDLNAKRGFSWDANPWVWVIEFKRAD